MLEVGYVSGKRKLKQKIKDKVATEYPIHIKLSFQRQHFEEIYFVNRQGNYFIGPTTKAGFLSFFIALLVFLSLVCASTIMDVHPTLIVMSLVATVLTFGGYLIVLIRLVKWKQTVWHFLKEAEKIQKHELVLKENSFCLVQDGTQTIVPWSNIKKAAISESHLSLTADEQFIFAKKSMEEDEFSKFVSMVKEKVG